MATIRLGIPVGFYQKQLYQDGTGGKLEIFALIWFLFHSGLKGIYLAAPCAPKASHPRAAQAIKS